MGLRKTARCRINIETQKSATTLMPLETCSFLERLRLQPGKLSWFFTSPAPREEGRARSHTIPLQPNRRHGSKTPTEASRTHPHFCGVYQPNCLENIAPGTSSAVAEFASPTASPGFLAAIRSAQPHGPNPRTAHGPKGRRRAAPPPSPRGRRWFSPRGKPPPMG